MRKRYYVAFLFLFIVLFGGIGWQILHQREQVYKGRTLTSWVEQYWVEEYDSPTSVTSGDPRIQRIRRNEAKFAIQQIGTNAIPILVRMASAHDVIPRSELPTAIKRLLPDLDSENYREMASRGFLVLGPLGKNGVPSLIHLLGSKNLAIQESAADCLGRIGPDAKAAIPVLIRLMDETNGMTRWEAGSRAQIMMTSLGRIHSDPAVVVPLLIKKLDEEHGANIPAIFALGALRRGRQDCRSHYLTTVDK